MEHDITFMNLSKPECDAIIIYYQEIESLIECALSFRKHYSVGNLMVARDTLPPIVISELNDLDPVYLPSFSTTQLFIDLQKTNRELESLTLQEFNEKISQDLKRLAAALSYCKTEYLIYLEADSRVMNRVMINKDIQMDTLDANRYPRKFLRRIYRVSGRKLPLKGWGFVTGYLECESAKKMLTWSKTNSNVLEDLFILDPRMAYLDFFLPVLAHLSGVNIGKTFQVGECLRDPNWKNSSYTLLHQYRIAYPK
jgi:hypothetical protein